MRSWIRYFRKSTSSALREILQERRRTNVENASGKFTLSPFDSKKLKMFLRNIKTIKEENECKSKINRFVSRKIIRRWKQTKANGVCRKFKTICSLWRKLYEGAETFLGNFKKLTLSSQKQLLKKNFKRLTLSFPRKFCKEDNKQKLKIIKRSIVWDTKTNAI